MSGAQGPEAQGSEPRIAVVFIHGQGQQRPMEDVQELARTTWEADGRGRTWTAPDARLAVADLQRITTEAGQPPPRVDFFEHYWAHYMAGNRLEHFLTWFRDLMARPRRDAPRNLLPVRQWVVRFMESITLLCILFSLGVSLLLPQPQDGLSRTDLRDAFFGLPIPTPTDVTYLLMLTTVGLIVAATLVIIVHEIIGGVRPRPRMPTLLSLKAAATSVSGAVPLLLGVGFAITVGIVSTLIFQGPLLQWGDLRLPLTLATAIAALLLTLRHLNTAATLAVIVSAAALVIALLGDIDAKNLWVYGELSGWIVPVKTFLHCEAGQPCFDAGGWSLHVFFALFSFAFLWSAFGVHVGIGAARHWWTRLFWTTIVIVVSGVVAHWHLNSLYSGDATGTLEKEQLQASWALYASGVTLVVVALAGIFVTRMAARAFLIPVMADSARYFSRNPEHIEARQQIRKAGIDLLDRLHDPKAGYSRIIVVAHSLGTAVGYELLMDYWARQSGSYVMRAGEPVSAALHDVERAAQALNGCNDEDSCEKARAALRIAQRRFSRRLRTMELEKTAFGHAEGKHWLISDFITLGSPLTHASLLLADSRADLGEKLGARKLAACPPTLHGPDGEVDACNGALTFIGWDGQPRPVHSALFAAVRWTNHFFKTASWIVVGDVIGGPIASAADERRARRGPDRGDLGRGVLDVDVDRLGTGKLFAHNEYWRSALSTKALGEHLRNGRKPQHIAKLIEAIDFEDKSPD
ncbi:MAG: hypothetical protein GC206_04905 [Alphaproteobacteria bacterium]|nr:hypothetical protein [Alphaproteobacteria bacterium]